MSNTGIKKLDLSQIRYEPEEGEVVYNTTEADKGYFIYHDGAWVKTNIESSGFNLGLYDMNKSIIAQLPDISKEDLEIGKKKINEAAHSGVYFMLLCNELKYYTVFKISDTATEKIEDVVIECIECFGATIKSIDNAPEGAIEIWIQKDDEAYVMYFFNYDSGVEICAI